MNRCVKKWGVAVAVMGLLIGCATAATYIDTFDGGSHDWSIDAWVTGGPGSPDGSLGSTDVDLDGDTELQITVDGTGTDGIFSDGNIAGSGQDYGNVDFGVGEDTVVRFVTFDFWANADAGNEGVVDHEPASLEFYFTGDGSTYWRTVLYDINTGSLVDGWNSFTVFLNENTLSQWGGTETFSSALSSVQEIGVIIGYQNWGSQEYGVENFELHNPEPGTYAVLAFALVSLGVTFRGKLSSGLKGLLRK